MWGSSFNGLDAEVMIIVNSILMGWETEALTTNISTPGFDGFLNLAKP